MYRIFEILFLGALFSLVSSKKLKVLSLKPNKGLDQISKLVEKGQIRPIIDGPYKLGDIPRLIQYFGEAKHLGKIVVEIEK